MHPRIFSRQLRPNRLRVYRGVLAFFLVVFLAMIWPVVTLFSRTRPLVLGLPFFLIYLTSLLVASFLVLLLLFRWEERTGSRPDNEEGRS